MSDIMREAMQDARRYGLIHDLLEDIAMSPEKRAQYYSLKHIKHTPNCPRQGDQCCSCGAAPTRCNFDNLLDSCEELWRLLRTADGDKAGE